ncbi:heterokaryon incompatibility protein-domain-containing protein [Cladorrhinum sp. PSN259]|nr:heterokaryon incompatibility protein-domain-containing protein [Cladorrhinum sp. PSN259]
MATPDYQYQPLAQPKAIRILYLSPGHRDARLSGRIQESTVDNAHAPYEALSYEWGSPDKTHLFHFDNNTVIRITKTLHDALTDLRPEPSAWGLRAIWADAICINQADTKEVEQQVAIMGDIYRHASRVVTYIGPEQDASSTSVEFARYLYKYAISKTSAPDPRLHSIDHLEELGLPPITDPRWPALRALLLKGWASRCWCAHEFLLNENLIMMCGRVELREWNLLAGIVELVFARQLPIYLLPGPVEDPYSLAECLANLAQVRELIWIDGEKFDLASLLQFSHPFRASNPRDKVYSLLGLAYDREELGLKIDYKRPVADLYTDVASRIFLQSQDLMLLDDIIYPKSVEGLPSWAPDWSTWVYGSQGVSYDETYSAGGSTTCKIRFDPGEGRLDIAGWLVGSISTISSPILPHYRRAHPDDIVERRRWLLEQNEFVGQLDPYPTREDITDVLWKTMVGNLTFDQTPANANYRPYFDAHCKLNIDSSDEELAMAREFIDSVRRKSRTRRLATIATGHLAAVPEVAKEGDFICVFSGARHLFVIRDTGRDGNFEFVGSAYVHGLMHGEAAGLEERIISLV